MSNLTEKGVLPIGVEYQGAMHREFELRPLKMKDSFNIKNRPYAEKAQENSEYMGLCMFAARLEKLGDIPKEAITPELLLEAYDDDMAVIMAADERIKKNLKSLKTQSGVTES